MQKPPYRRLLAATLIGAFCAGGATAADDYPTRPIRMVVAATAGGPADFVGRLAAVYLSELWRQQIVIDNRGGSSGIFATETVARANPDGYSLLLGSTSNFSIVPAVAQKLPFDFPRDLSTTGLLAVAPHVVVVREGIPAKTVKELIALAKPYPNKYSFASAGPATIVHMSGELFRQQAGLELVHVPFKGGAQAAVGVLAGEADILANDLQTILPHVKSGRMRILAAANPKRLAPIPDVPTFAEIGMPGMVSSTWWGIAVPAKTPPALKAKIAEAQAKVVARPEYVERLKVLAMEPLVMTTPQATAFIASEAEKWRKVAVAGNIKME